VRLSDKSNEEGYAVLRSFTEEQPEAQIILMTGHGSAVGALDAVSSGAYDYLMKPFEVKDVQRISQAVRNGFEKRARSAVDDDPSPPVYVSDIDLVGVSAAFVELMNARAKALGLADTTYQSPHGLPPGKGQTADITSAHDLAVLGRELMKFPDVMRWAGMPAAGFRNDTLQMSNTNHLVRTYPGATGLKTGYYQEAGFEVTATATRNDLRLIAVVLGVVTKPGCFAEAARLMNDAFANYRVIAAAHRAAVVSEVPVTGGTDDRVKALATGDLLLLVKRAEDRGIVVEARVPRLLQAPVSRSQPLGDVVVRRGDEELGKVTVVADRDVAATGWLSWLSNRALSGRTSRSAAR